MKTYHYWHPEKLNPTESFKMNCKCKFCKSTYVATLTENVITKKALLKKKDETEMRPVGFFGKLKEFERSVKIEITVYKGKCPSCGKKKTLFMVVPERKEYVYGDWKRSYNYSCCYSPYPIS